MGIGRAEGTGAAASVREKVSGLGSALVKFGNNVIGGIRAIFAEMKAKDDKVVVNPPGLKQQDVDNKTVKQLAKEEARLSDILKIGGLTALSLLINNPLPLMFAQRHAANLKERIKAKEKELTKIKRQVARGKTRTDKRKKIKNDQDLRGVDAIKKKRDAYEKNLNVTQKRVTAKAATREFSEADQKRATAAVKNLKRLGFSDKEAKGGVRAALRNSTPGDINNFTNNATREASLLRNKGKG